MKDRLMRVQWVDVGISVEWVFDMKGCDRD
jgi:hypothetical protein